ncbi:MAG: glycoside hydrolase family 127 protein, partial [Deltaproteobacteria bacterium]|nr:glycoside hydrolase family 127 protein [Deltaproteobacteria bacterium]
MKQSVHAIPVCYLCILLMTTGFSCKSSPPDYPIQPVPFTEVQVDDAFWLPRIETNRTVTIPFAMNKNVETNRVNNLAIAAGRTEGQYEGRRFNDTDVYKVIEGAAYSLSVHPDPDLERQVDELIELIAAAQEEDGYLYAARTADPDNPAPGAGPERWSRLNGSHELYNAGHMYEAAVAYCQATGKTAFLDVAIKNAGLLVRTFGPEKLRGYPGHQEVEIGLAKLFRITGNRDYLELAKFFLDMRGREQTGEPYGDDTPFAIYNRKPYMQAHKPVLEQAEAVGHAVRASYMYTGMADVAALGGHPEYISAIDRLWENVVFKKLYLTGGIGARHTTEAFGDAYELPNESAYTETCAAVGNVFWNLRMFLLHGEARYIDVLERTLYNGALSGVSLEGDCFFYQNPLASNGRQVRSPWFEVSCCPGNITRLLPSVPGYIYAQEWDALYVNLFIQNTAEIELKGKKVRVRQETEYPWSGGVKISLFPEKDMEFALRIRIPGWALDLPVPSDLYCYAEIAENSPSLKVNGTPVEIVLEKGYAQLERTWTSGDVVELELPMPVRRVLSHPNVEANQGRVALERGPLVYCAEGVDNDGRVHDIVVPDNSAFQVIQRPDLLQGIIAIAGEVETVPGKSADTAPEANQRTLFAIPYYAWAHRGRGEMAVWLKR